MGNREQDRGCRGEPFCDFSGPWPVAQKDGASGPNLQVFSYQIPGRIQQGIGSALKHGPIVANHVYGSDSKGS